MHYQKLGLSTSDLLPILALAIIVLTEPNLSTSASIQQNPTISANDVSSRTTTHYPIHEVPLAPDSKPLGMTLGPGGNIWFAENNSTKIVEYSPENGTFHYYPIPLNGSSMIWFIIFDPLGSLWFSNQLQPYLWRFSPTTGQFANFTTGNEYIKPFGLAFDNFTDQIWFTSTYTNQIGFFNLNGDTATIGKLINETETTPSPNSPQIGPTDIQVGPSGNIFVSQPFSSNIVEYSPSKQAFIREWNLRPGTQAAGINLNNSSATIWFANDASSLFGYVNERNNFSNEFSTSPFELFGSVISQPYWIRVSSNGTIWFDEYAANKIARYEPASGLLTEFAIPTKQSTPLQISIDNLRHEVWFTEFAGNNLGTLMENSSCNCIVQLSTRSIVIGAKPISFYLKYISAKHESLDSSSPAPFVSGDFQASGRLTGNLTYSSRVLNSTYYEITLARGPDLNSGNYSITICPRTSNTINASSPASVLECATSFIAVMGQSSQISTNSPPTNQSNRYTTYITLIVIDAAVVFFSALYLNQRRNRGSKNAS